MGNSIFVFWTDLDGRHLRQYPNTKVGKEDAEERCANIIKKSDDNDLVVILGNKMSVYEERNIASDIGASFVKGQIRRNIILAAAEEIKIAERKLE